MSYAELQVATGFSFLRGASRAEEIVAAASVLELKAIGITDRNTVAGVVRAHEAARQADMHLVLGARLVFRDVTPDVLCYPTDRAAWGRLTRLLTVGKTRAKKGECHLDYADLEAYAEGQVLIAVAPVRIDADFRRTLQRLSQAWPKQVYLAMTRRHQGDDTRRLRTLSDLALKVRVPTLATNDVLYHVPERRMLHDVLTAVRLGCTVEQAGLALQPNGERHLKSPREMRRLFRDYPDAVIRTSEIVDRCQFSLNELQYEYPDEPVPPGTTPDSHLAMLTWSGAAERYPNGVPEYIEAILRKELLVIERLGYARYFLTVNDIVKFARSAGILCQGRGSSANSAVCYCLGVTAVDPAQIDLLFERFVSAERQEPPDIDVDFEHERREEVIQYIYQRYSRDRAGIAATVIHYRPKMAIREVGKAMGLAEDVTAALSAQSWNTGDAVWSEGHLREAGLDPENPLLRRVVSLARDLIGFPRHLSQHVGGFVLTRSRLDEVVPIGNAAMAKRTFIEWDKDDIDALGIMKIDVLALGMLTCIHKAFDILRARGRPMDDLATIPREDPAVYRMLQRGDSLGVFQVESRAQMNMLPRLKPERFYDLVIEVAIVRPGPIQGDMVHPYLRRRQNLEPVHYPSPSLEHGLPDELERVLGKTMGVPLFQEQAMRIAIEAAKFTPEEANQLRRAMATFRHVGTIHSFYDKMVEGMVARGYEREFAEGCFRQIEGFGTYGFPESHAASFALLVYASAWLKCHHPSTFACALLNSQPMGFYAPAQIVRDAHEHGVIVRGVDVRDSGWDCSIEHDGALRLGLRLISGFQKEWADIASAASKSFLQLARSGLSKTALIALAEADAFRSFGMDRQAGLWAVRGLDDLQDLPLFWQTEMQVHAAALPQMTLPEQVIADYQTTGLSLKAHPLRFLRPRFVSEGLLTCAEASLAQDGALLRVAGVVLVRQRPGSAHGVVFATIEDETGIANIVVWPSLLERFRREVLGASLLVVQARIQRSGEGLVHLVAEQLFDRTQDMAETSDSRMEAVLAKADEMPRPSRGSRHPRDERVVPRSRDFH